MGLLMNICPHQGLVRTRKVPSTMISSVLRTSRGSRALIFAFEAVFAILRLCSDSPWWQSLPAYPQRTNKKEIQGTG